MYLIKNTEELKQKIREKRNNWRGESMANVISNYRRSVKAIWKIGIWFVKSNKNRVKI